MSFKKSKQNVRMLLISKVQDIFILNTYKEYMTCIELESLSQKLDEVVIAPSHGADLRVRFKIYDKEL